MRVRKRVVSANSGKSMSNENKFGIRRSSGGNLKAPRSLRRKGKTWLAECSGEELRKAGVQ